MLDNDSAKLLKLRYLNTSTAGDYINRYGFTLIELIIVLAIIGTVISISVPFVSNFLFRANLESSAEDIVSTLRWARRLAITKRKEYMVIFDPQRGKYWLQDKEGNIEGERHSLQENIVFADPELNKMQEEDGIVEFDNPDDSGISFYPQGTAESGSIYLRGKETSVHQNIRSSFQKRGRRRSQLFPHRVESAS